MFKKWADMTPEEQHARIEKSRATRAANKAKKTGNDIVSAPDGEGDGVVQIDVTPADVPHDGGAKLPDVFKSAFSGNARPAEATVKRGRPRKELASAEDIGNIFVVPIIGLAFLAVPLDFRMNDMETAAIAKPIASILIRHVKIFGKMSQDMLDIAAILAVLVAWGRRVNVTQIIRQQGKANVLPLRRSAPVATPLSYDPNTPPTPQSEVSQNGQAEQPQQLDYATLSGGRAIESIIGGRDH